MNTLHNILRKLNHILSENSEGYDVRDFRVGTLFGTSILFTVTIVNYVFPDIIPDAPVFRHTQIVIQLLTVFLSYKITFIKKWGNEIGNLFTLSFALLLITIAYNKHFEIYHAVLAFMGIFIMTGMFKDKKMMNYYLLITYSYFLLMLLISDATLQNKTFFATITIPFLTVGYYVFSVKLDAVSNLEKGKLEVQQREAWFRNIFDNVPVGIALVDSKFMPYKFNKYFLELTGYKEEEVIEKGILNIIHSDDALHGEAYTSFIQGVNIKPIEQRLLTKDGKQIWTRVKASQIDMDGISSAIVIFNDITLEKEAELKLTEQSLQLKSHNEALEEFSYVISHDLQEPLRMITSFSQIIQKKYISKIDDERANHDFNYVIDGAKRMSYLIRDMLEYSRWSAKDLPLEQVDTELVLEEMHKNLMVAIDTSHAEIIIHNAPIIIANKLVLGQIFQNLVGNAIRYAHPNRTPIIEISIVKRINDVLFTVKDNGIGFEDKYKERIFGIFQRLHPDKSSGTGMGLAICKRVIERQGGQIWAESELDIGTTFYFTLPIVEVKNTEGVVDNTENTSKKGVVLLH